MTKEKNKNGKESIICSINGRDNYLSNIARKIGLTFSHVCNLVKELEDDGIIIRKMEGRKKIIKLTEKGQRIKELYLQLNQEYSDKCRKANK